MSGVACYIQRSHSGQAIAGLRLVASGLDLTWAAPDSQGLLGTPGAGGPIGDSGGMSVGGGGAASGSAGSPDGANPLAIARQAAAWIAENLRALNTRTLDALCIDPQGAVCSWLAAPSPEAKVIRATITQAGLSGSDSDSGTAARLALLPASDIATAPSELSIQALAVLEDDASGAGQSSSDRAQAGGVSNAGRFALVSIPDTSVRVLLDELDDRGIEVGQIVSLWHAMASVLDPSVRDGVSISARSLADNAPENLRVVAGSGVTSAILLIDPLGTLSWAWALEGRLLVGGSLRLKHVAIKRSNSPSLRAGLGAPGDFADSLSDEYDTDARAGESGDGGSGDGSSSGRGAGNFAASTFPGAPDNAARRLGASEDAIYDERLECSSTDVGRLVLDWLSWSAQLGRGPERVISIGPATVAPPPAADAAPGSTRAEPRHSSEGLGEAIARAWGRAGGAGGSAHDTAAIATIDLIEEADPIGLVLSRLAGLTERGTRAASPAPAGAQPQADPRVALVDLSTRPTRATRRQYQWTALAIAALAMALIAIGYQLHASADGAKDLVAEARQTQTDALKSISSIVPNMHLSIQPEKDLQEQLRELRRRAALVKPLTPIIPEVGRILTAFESVRSKLPEAAQSELKIVEISFSPVAPAVRLQVPDAGTGPEIEVALQGLPGSVRWTGRSPPATSGPRQFILQGQYLDTPTTPSTSAAASAAAPAPASGTSSATGGGAGGGAKP